MSELPFKDPKNTNPKKSAREDRSGHRARLRARFKSGGVDALADYELLELILFRAIPRRDTKPLAKALIKRFGTFSEVLHAPEELLSEVSGASEGVIGELKLIRASALKMMQGDVMDKPVLSSWTELIEYCRSAMAYAPVEQFRILFLDKKNKLIADEVQQEGTVDHTPVYIREIVKRTLELSATAVILVHNHPSGDPSPSQGDITMTRQIVDAAKPLGIIIHDHIIVGREGHASLKGMGLM